MSVLSKRKQGELGGMSDRASDIVLVIISVIILLIVAYEVFIGPGQPAAFSCSPMKACKGSILPDREDGKNVILSPLAFHISYDPQSSELRRG